MQFTTATIAAFIGAVAAQAPTSMTVHVVSVAGDGNVFSPERVTAAVGDMIQFQFRAGNHSVVQSNFDNPCTPIGQSTNSTGFYSGYTDVAASGDMIPTYTVNVTSTTPMWVYCSAASHCQNGMTMVINENPTLNSTRTLDNYKLAASAAPANVGGDGVASNPGGSGGGSGAGGDAGGDSGAGGAGGDSGAGGSEAGSEGATATAPSAGSMVAVSRTMGLLGVAAALSLL